MTGIRALERADLPRVSALFELVMRSGEDRPNPQVAEYLTRVVLDDPWADPEIPSLVHEDPDGRVVGFIAASTRRMTLDGRPVRVAVSSNLVAHPDWRSRGVGVLLNRKLLAGPQDLTVADRANDDSRALWTGLGGQELVASSLAWWRILRPGATAGALAARRKPSLARGARLAGAPLDALAARVPRLGAPPPPDPAGTTEELTPEVAAEEIEQAKRLRLRPEYDAGWLTWAFAELDRLTDRGRLTARLVRGPQGRVLGWFLYLLPDGRHRRGRPGRRHRRPRAGARPPRAQRPRRGGGRGPGAAGAGDGRPGRRARRPRASGCARPRRRGRPRPARPARIHGLVLLRPGRGVAGRPRGPAVAVRVAVPRSVG